MLLWPVWLKAEPSLQQKRQQVQQLEAEINQIDDRVEVTVEQYNQAVLSWQKINNQVNVTKAKLQEAENKRKQQQELLNTRLAGLYKSGEDLSFLEMVLSSQSFGQFLNALDSAQRISEHDAKLLLKIKKLKLFIQKQEVKLEKELARADAIVTTIRQKKQAIENQISAKQKELNKARQELRQLEQQEEARNAALRARLANLVRPAAAASIKIPSIPASGRGALVVKFAFQELGKPYVWAAAGPNSFDCSGLTMYVYAKVGVSLPHSAEAQYSIGQRIDRGSLQPGDLVFFSSGGGYISHVGIYIGNNSYISAPRTGDVVKVQSMNRRGYVGASRP